MPLALLSSACGGGRPSLEGERALPSGLPSDGGLLRVPAQGGSVVLLRGDSLLPSSWKLIGSVKPLARPLSVDRDEHVAYFVSATGKLVGVDLATRTAQEQLPFARNLVGSTDGLVFGLDSTRRALRFAARTLTTYRAGLIDGPLQLFRAPGGLVSAYSPSAHLVQVVSDKGEVRRFEAPEGSATASWYGDLLAITNDSGITFIEQTPSAATSSFVSLRGTPITSVFSPSAHRLYVAREKGDLAVVDRFGYTTLYSITLPGIATSLRVDRSGRWLMAAPAKGDSLWLIDLVRGEVAGSYQTPWREDLPTIMSGHSLIVREGDDVVAYDLSVGTTTERVRLRKAAGDLFMPVLWTPGDGRRLAGGTVPPVTTPDSTASVTPPVTDVVTDPIKTEEPVKGKSTGEEWFLQVSSSQNQEFAKALSDQLADAGYPARVLTPETPEQGYRVILGPYGSQESAEAVGKKLGRAYFVTRLNQPDR